MKKFLIALILFSASFTALSQSLIDGMSVHNLPSNRGKYYYGEPIILYFLTKNETDKIKRYWEPTTSINVKLELVDLRSGKTFYYAHEPSDYGHMRNYWVDNPPPVEASFSPMDTKFL